MHLFFLERKGVVMFFVTLTKHEHASGKWIFGEFLLAKPRQGVNALATIDGFDGHQHAHLRRDLRMVRLPFSD